MARVLSRGLLLFLGGNVDKRILIGVGLAVGVGALWVGYTLLNPPGITLKKCNKVTTEMKRDDVVKLMGMPGEKEGDDVLYTLRFLNKDKSYCHVTLVGPHVIKVHSEGLE
jgi:hypothetical protein